MDTPARDEVPLGRSPYLEPRGVRRAGQLPLAGCARGPEQPRQRAPARGAAPTQPAAGDLRARGEDARSGRGLDLRATAFGRAAGPALSDSHGGADLGHALIGSEAPSIRREPVKTRPPNTGVGSHADAVVLAGTESRTDADARSNTPTGACPDTHARAHADAGGPSGDADSKPHALHALRPVAGAWAYAGEAARPRPHSACPRAGEAACPRAGEAARADQAGQADASSEAIGAVGS